MRTHPLSYHQALLHHPPQHSHRTMAAAAVATLPPIKADGKPPAAKKVRFTPDTNKIMDLVDGVDKRAFSELTAGEFRVDTGNSFDGTPMGNAWKPFAGGRGVEITCWIPEDLATSQSMTDGLNLLGKGLLNSLQAYAGTMPTAKRRSFLKKLNTQGFVLTNPGKANFDSTGNFVGWKESAYARVTFRIFKTRDSTSRLDGTFRIEDQAGANITETLAGDAVPVETDALQFRDAEGAVADVEDFAPFVRFNDASSEWIRGAMTRDLTYEGATVQLNVKGLHLWFGRALVTDHLGYITVKLLFAPGYKPAEDSPVPDTFVVGNSLTAVLKDETAAKPKVGFL